jgi:hypothetical protein
MCVHSAARHRTTHSIPFRYMPFRYRPSRARHNQRGPARVRREALRGGLIRLIAQAGRGFDE